MTDEAQNEKQDNTVWIVLGVIALIVVVLLVGYQSQKKETAQACHDKVAERAKFVPDFVSTQIDSSGRITGRVKLQNGFGAWTMHEYECSPAGRVILNRV